MNDPAPSTGGCMRGGCSGQICADHPVVTTCEWLPCYAAFRYATCERQAKGECGWTWPAGMSAPTGCGLIVWIP